MVHNNEIRIPKIYGRLKGQNVMGRVVCDGPDVSYCAYIVHVHVQALPAKR